MSSNVHHLYLFFDTPLQLRRVQLICQYLARQSWEQAERWIHELDPALDRSALWDDDWVNASALGHPQHLELGFDTRTTAGMPWRLLETLFQHGLQAAVLHVFYDQVGESERYHFDAGQWVSHHAWLSRYPERQVLVDTDGEVYPQPGQEEGADGTALTNPAQPMTITRLRERDQERDRQAQESVQALLDTMASLRKSGVSPVQGIVGLFMLRAGFRGLCEAVAFTVIAALAFRGKGLWLWLALGLVLAVVLPLYRMAGARREFAGQGGGDAAS
ncbi:hypothetical protein DelCs14_3025 [Delftia sp. Cs1-4]|uniref:hypothetical protein n=1 Tax=Delftia TaxID=80865 RepID=UPI00020E7FEF|nr:MULTISPECIES: hypothetical protein [Delftia]AEF90029.1 hypothetical protein DelCs14_3025 [Delftia sp. Cs1-4]SOE36187.1 hypothetical protein SAMN05216519_2188 [Delftia acidovorans]